jgi:glycosyltransferase involved in cell wall biosynthesis
VSTPFAHELRNDPLQRACFTNHLLDAFSRNPPIGIENGIFGSPAKPFPRKISHTDVLSEKEKWHKEFFAVLSSYRDKKIIGALDFSGKNNDAPVFFLSGRLDSMQKGFDSVFWAFQRLKRGSAKLLFSPNIGAGKNGRELDFFIDIAGRCKGDITIWPLHIPQREYEALLRGAGYLVMPSFYEPFGAATEGLACGTPVVARATGGLWIQTDPYDAIDVPKFYGPLLSPFNQVRKRAATGFLYREQYPEKMSGKDWTRIFESSLSERIQSPLYEAIVEAAYDALRSAISMYRDRKAYASLIANGFRSLPQFDWKFAVAKYRKVYDAASESAV